MERTQNLRTVRLEVYVIPPMPSVAGREMFMYWASERGTSRISSRWNFVPLMKHGFAIRMPRLSPTVPSRDVLPCQSEVWITLSFNRPKTTLILYVFRQKWSSHSIATTLCHLTEAAVLASDDSLSTSMQSVEEFLFPPVCHAVMQESREYERMLNRAVWYHVVPET
jgi:hypothetical protein